MATKSNLPNRAQRRKVRQRKQRNLILIMAILALPVIGGLIYMSMPNSAPPISGPQFTKQGTLTFLSEKSGEPITAIDIEIKADDSGRAEGMMWRKSMEEDQGMLFIMERAEPQSFWMRNTYIPLDILFISEDQRILNIRANAQPQTLSPQASQGDAKYVLEVIGGLTDKMGVQPGDSVTFERQ
jgi:uncharacterized membrane protein (UPF0127 family)